MKVIDIHQVNEKKIIQISIKVLKNAGLIVYPTETCYGAGVNATLTPAVDKLFAFKGKRETNPTSVAVADQKMAERLVVLNNTALNLYQKFLPGPLTVVSRSRGVVDSRLLGLNDGLGIRIPDYPLVLKIIKDLSNPITATSANTSGRKTPYSISDLLNYTSRKKLGYIDLFLDAGKLPPRPPSTVVDTTLNEQELIRQGDIIIPDVSGLKFLSNSELNTKEIAKQLFAKYRNLLRAKPLVIALQGELGAGKTQFVKGLAEALSIQENVPSPTFVLIREYPYTIEQNKRTLFHVDTWRMEKGSELLDLGFESMLRPGNIIAIEWLQKVKPILIEFQKNIPVLWVTFDILSGSRRRLTAYLGKLEA